MTSIFSTDHANIFSKHFGKVFQKLKENVLGLHNKKCQKDADNSMHDSQFLYGKGLLFTCLVIKGYIVLIFGQKRFLFTDFCLKGFNTGK